MSFSQDWKKKAEAKAEELGLEAKAAKAAEAASEGAHQARDKLTELAHDNRDKIDTFVDRVGEAFNELTDNRYTAKVDKAKVALADNLDRLDATRTAKETGPDGTTSPADGSDWKVAPPGGGAAGSDPAPAPQPPQSPPSDQPPGADLGAHRSDT